MSRPRRSRDLKDCDEVNQEDWYVASFDLKSREWLTFKKSQLQDEKAWKINGYYSCYVAAGQLGSREDSNSAVDGFVDYCFRSHNGKLKEWKAILTIFDLPANKEDPLERKHILEAKSERERERTKRGRGWSASTKLRIDYQLQLSLESLLEFSEDSWLSIMAVEGFKKLLVIGKERTGDNYILITYEVGFDWQTAVLSNDSTMLIKLTNPSAIELPFRIVLWKGYLDFTITAIRILQEPIQLAFLFIYRSV